MALDAWGSRQAELRQPKGVVSSGRTTLMHSPSIVPVPAVLLLYLAVGLCTWARGRVAWTWATWSCRRGGAGWGGRCSRATSDLLLSRLSVAFHSGLSLGCAPTGPQNPLTSSTNMRQRWRALGCQPTCTSGLTLSLGTSKGERCGGGGKWGRWWKMFTLVLLLLTAGKSPASSLWWRNRRRRPATMFSTL